MSAQPTTSLTSTQRVVDGVKVLDKVAFTRELFDKFNKEHAITLGLIALEKVDTYAVQSQLDDSFDDMAVDEARSVFDGLQVELEEVDEHGAAQIGYVAAFDAFARMEKMFLGANPTCFLRVTLEPFAANSPTMMAAVVRALQTKFAILQVGAEWIYGGFRLPPTSEAIVSLMSAVAKANDAVNKKTLTLAPGAAPAAQASVCVDSAIGKFGWKWDSEKPIVLVGIVGLGSNLVVDHIKEVGQVGCLQWDPSRARVVVNTSEGKAVPMESERSLTSAFRVHVGNIDGDDVGKQDGLCSELSILCAKVCPSLAGSTLAMRGDPRVMRSVHQRALSCTFMCQAASYDRYFACLKLMGQVCLDGAFPLMWLRRW